MKEISFRNDVLPLKNELYRLALRITLSHQEAEDVVQDTLIKVWNKRDSWPQIDSIEAYSLTICRNLALDRTRKASFQQPSLETEQMAEPASTTANPQEKAIRSDQIALVRTIINSLPEKQRSCIQLRDFEGKSYKEIAEALHITEEQVKVNIFRARQTIKQKYQKLDEYGL
jgi:RNA polymerase sigma-70 factor (ECF subfamily)